MNRYESIIKEFHYSNYSHILSIESTERIAFWRHCLLFNTSLVQKHSWRSAYDEVAQTCSVNNLQPNTWSTLERMGLPDDVNWDVVNPLNQDNDNPWNQVYADEQLKQEILLDVKRILISDCEDDPIQLWIMSPAVQESLCRVLFCIAKQIGEHSYKQGMHEIVAHVFVAVKQGSEFSEEFLCHDSYHVAYQILKRIAPLYGDSSEIEKLKKQVWNVVMPKTLPKVHALLNGTVSPELWLLRHQRLLLTRELDKLQDRLTLWDHIFVFQFPIPGVDSVSFYNLRSVFPFSIDASLGILSIQFQDSPTDLDSGSILHKAMRPVSFTGTCDIKVLLMACLDLYKVQLVQNHLSRNMVSDFNDIYSGFSRWIDTAASSLSGESIDEFKALMYQLNQIRQLAMYKESFPATTRHLSIKDFKTKAAEPPFWKQRFSK